MGMRYDRNSTSNGKYWFGMAAKRTVASQEKKKVISGANLNHALTCYHNLLQLNTNIPNFQCIFLFKVLYTTFFEELMPLIHG